jgi:hypothetical protein
MFRLVSCVIRTMVCYAEHTDTHLGTGDRDRTASGCARATVFSVLSLSVSRVRSQRDSARDRRARGSRGGAARAPAAAAPGRRRAPPPAPGRCDVCVLVRPARPRRRPRGAGPGESGGRRLTRAGRLKTRRIENTATNALQTDSDRRKGPPSIGERALRREGAACCCRCCCCREVLAAAEGCVGGHKTLERQCSCWPNAAHTTGRRARSRLLSSRLWRRTARRQALWPERVAARLQGAWQPLVRVLAGGRPPSRHACGRRALLRVQPCEGVADGLQCAPHGLRLRRHVWS